MRITTYDDSWTTYDDSWTTYDDSWTTYDGSWTTYDDSWTTYDDPWTIMIHAIITIHASCPKGPHLSCTTPELSSY